MDTIDWEVAQWIGEVVAGRPAHGPPHADSIEPLTQRFASEVSAYSGLTVAGPLPPLETVDRPHWIAANLKSMRPLLEPLAERSLAARSFPRLSSPFARAARSASGALIGAQVGALAGVLSQRVLGQYDIELLNPSPAPRLLLVGPNLTQAARALRVDRDELTSWVAIHEVTHAVQFAAASWLQGHLAGLMQELIEQMQVNVSSSDLLAALRHGGLRTVLERLRRGEVMRLTLGEGRWALVERMQTAMSLIEGHAEHVMDAVGAHLLPSMPKLRDALNRRRATRSVPWRVLERLLGLELKLRQYEDGRRFCDAVAARQGPHALARAFSAADALPSHRELHEPELWLARVGYAS